jgi:hypothetical protein
MLIQATLTAEAGRAIVMQQIQIAIDRLIDVTVLIID